MFVQTNLSVVTFKLIRSKRLLQAKQTHNRTEINQNYTLLISVIGNIFLEIESKSQHSKTFLSKYEGMCRIKLVTKKLVNISTRLEYCMAQELLRLSQ